MEKLDSVEPSARLTDRADSLADLGCSAYPVGYAHRPGRRCNRLAVGPGLVAEGARQPGRAHLRKPRTKPMCVAARQRGDRSFVSHCLLSHDLAISLDCSDPQRTGQPPLTGPGPLSVPLINIDHHITNTNFGTVNLVDPGCVATAQLVLELADAFGWHLSQPAALCLLTGIVTDTRGLRTSNVDAQVLRAVLRLTEAGALLAEITRRTLDQRPLSIVRLWGEAIGGLQLDDGILWTEVTGDMLKRWPSSEDGMTGLSNFLAGVREARVIAVLAERRTNTPWTLGCAPRRDTTSQE